MARAILARPVAILECQNGSSRSGTAIGTILECQNGQWRRNCSGRSGHGRYTFPLVFLIL